MFFDGSKLPTSVLWRIPQGTFILSLVPIGQVVSDQKIFVERNKIKNREIKVKKGNNSNMAQWIKMKIWPQVDLILLKTVSLSELA